MSKGLILLDSNPFKLSLFTRSVSCNSSMSKCNKTEDDEEYGAKDEADTERATQRPLLASDAEFPPPPPPPNGSSLSCSNPDLVQVGTICRGGYCP